MSQLNVRLSNIDQLIEDGLGSIKKLPYYRIILSNPAEGVTNMSYRDLTVKLLEQLFPMILNDSILFQRLRQLLEYQYKIECNLNETDIPNLEQKPLTRSQKTLETIRKVIKK